MPVRLVDLTYHATEHGKHTKQRASAFPGSLDACRYGHVEAWKGTRNRKPTKFPIQWSMSNQIATCKHENSTNVYKRLLGLDDLGTAALKTLGFSDV